MRVSVRPEAGDPDRFHYCTVSITWSACDNPTTAVAVTVICDVPNGARCRNVNKGRRAPVPDVAVTVTVGGFGTTAGVLYNPVASTVPLALPP